MSGEDLSPSANNLEKGQDALAAITNVPRLGDTQLPRKRLGRLFTDWVSDASRVTDRDMSGHV